MSYKDHCKVAQMPSYQMFETHIATIYVCYVLSELEMWMCHCMVLKFAARSCSYVATYMQQISKALTIFATAFTELILSSNDCNSMPCMLMSD